MNFRRYWSYCIFSKTHIVSTFDNHFLKHGVLSDVDWIRSNLSSPVWGDVLVVVRFCKTQHKENNRREESALSSISAFHRITSIHPYKSWWDGDVLHEKGWRTWSCFCSLHRLQVSWYENQISDKAWEVYPSNREISSRFLIANILYFDMWVDILKFISDCYNIFFLIF